MVIACPYSSAISGVILGASYEGKHSAETSEASSSDSTFQSAAHPFMASPACASVQGGWVAQLDPRLREGEWAAFELDLAEVFAQVPERVLYEDVITFPPVREDLAFAVDEALPAGQLIAAAREAAGPELRDMRVFDVYRGDQVGPGRKSLAFSVTFQSSERTLSDEDAAALRDRIVTALRKRFGAELRSSA